MDIKLYHIFCKLCIKTLALHYILQMHNKLLKIKKKRRKLINYKISFPVGIFDKKCPVI
jgi:hypothetical protein